MSTNQPTDQDAVLPDPDDQALAAAIREADIADGLQPPAPANGDDPDAGSPPVTEPPADQRAPQGDAPPAPGGQPAGQGGGGAAAPATKPPPGFVPVAAVVSERAARQKAEQERDYFRGQADARKEMGAQAPSTAGKDQAPPPPDFDKLLASKRQELLDLAEKVDSGDLGMKAYKEREFEIQEEIESIAQQRWEASQPKAPETTAKQGGDIYDRFSLSDAQIVEQKANELFVQYPELGMLAPDYVKDLAVRVERMLAAGGTVLTSSARDTLTLHQAVARAARAQFDRVATPEQKAHRNSLLPKKPAQQQKPAAPGAPVLSREALARQAKLDMRDQMPPDTRNLGGQGTARVYSEKDIEGMSEHELMALPKSVQDKFLYNR